MVALPGFVLFDSVHCEIGDIVLFEFVPVESVLFEIVEVIRFEIVLSDTIHFGIFFFGTFIVHPQSSSFSQ